MKKRIRFERVVKNNHQIWNNKREFLGDIYLENDKWIFYPQADDVEHRISTWFTGDCLHAIADYMQNLDT